MDNQEYRILLSRFSHEARNPLALITSFLQLLAREYPQIRPCPYFRQIQENLQLLRQLLDEMSHYNNASKIQPRPVDPGEFLGQLRLSVSGLLSARGIRLDLDLPPALPRVSMDPSRMRQVFYNLIRNAEEAMPEGGWIRISAAAQEQWVAVTLLDSGPSIPREYLPTLFDPLVTHKQDGTGLGLAICREILLAHGGSISVSPDGRPAFTLRLPRLPSPA